MPTQQREFRGPWRKHSSHAQLPCVGKGGLHMESNDCKTFRKNWELALVRKAGMSCCIRQEKV